MLIVVSLFLKCMTFGAFRGYGTGWDDLHDCMAWHGGALFNRLDIISMHEDVQMAGHCSSFQGSYYASEIGFPADISTRGRTASHF